MTIGRGMLFAVLSHFLDDGVVVNHQMHLRVLQGSKARHRARDVLDDIRKPSSILKRAFVVIRRHPRLTIAHAAQPSYARPLATTSLPHPNLSASADALRTRFRQPARNAARCP